MKHFLQMLFKRRSESRLKKTKQRIIFGITDYSRQLSDASEKAAEVHYQEGICLAKSGFDFETEKSAAKRFIQVETTFAFSPDVKVFGKDAVGTVLDIINPF